MKKCLAVLAGLSIFAVSSAYAGCVDTYGIGAKATAMGGAYSAYADDPFAVHYNPAGLSQIKGPVMAAGVHVMDPSLTIKGFNIEGSKLASKGVHRFGDDFPILVAPHMGYAMPINDKISFGIAAYAPWGLEVRWPKYQDGVYDSFHSYYERLAVTPSISYKVNDKLSLGFGISLGYSKSGAEKYMSYFGTNNDPIPTLGGLTGQQFKNTVLASGPAHPLFSAALLDGARIDAEMEDDFNYGFNFGLMYKPTETITLGLTYRSHTQAKFSGDIKFTSPTLEQVFGSATQRGKVRMQYDHPQQIQAGIRYQPHERFSMEFDIVWTNWSYNERQKETITFKGSSFDAIYDRKWDDTRQIRFGAEYIVNDWCTLRGGYFYDPTPIPDDTLDLMWPDADKKTYSIGAGFKVTQNLTIDTVFQITHIEQDRVIGGESSNMNHAYETIVDPTNALGQGVYDHPKVSAKAGGYLYGFGVTVSYAF
ncbi:outer membrane protein transport protein [Desulfococcaceae bacterium OttesenSCG-928-F15]|nr:outer membrane protein transport protein [Desulfococcaceae bacterium OttesenSCG-928-F15]